MISLIYKQNINKETKLKQIHRQREQTGNCQRGHLNSEGPYFLAAVPKHWELHVYTPPPCF